MAPPPPPPPSSISSYRPLRTSLCRPPRPPHLTSRTCPVSRTHSPPHPLLSILSSSASSSSSPLQTQRHPPISSQIAQHFRRLSTSSTSSLPPRPPLFCLLLSLLLCTLLTSHQVHADRNRFYHISALCLRERVHPLYKKIDGAVISSKSENNLDCTITFQTDTILQKFMLRFEKLALDCDDHLYIYDGAHTHGSHKAHLSCRSTRAEVGTIYTAGNFLTLHYTTDAYSKADNGFRLIITAFKDSKNYCREHRCANQFCISRDLVCDGVNHCADNSDESYFASCQEFEPEDTIIGLEPLYFITLVVVVFLACLVLVITVSFCLCRRERLLARQQQRIALQQQYGTHPLMLDGIGGHTGATPILQHNSSYNSKLDGCTMITSLDGYGATRNGGLVNSFTHTTLQNSHQAGANFATLPHLHHNHATTASPQHGSQSSSVAATSGSPHVRFGTLPVRGGGGNEKPPPPYPGSYFNAIGQQQQGQQGHGQIALGPMNGGPANGNGILVNGSNGLVHHTSQQQNAGGPVQTQVIYTAK